MEQSQALPV
uniref:Uncharacterized protein n=1 Tax=Anguilla anguilla TaxID=7936 RepID=A0A0E9T153_ANGAN